MNHRSIPLYRRSLVLLAVITTVAIGLRLYRLGDYSFWMDETESIYSSVVGRSFHPPFFHVFLNLWLLFFTSEFGLRTLPVIFGVAAIPALYFLTLHISTHRTALTASLLLSVSPFAVYYSRELRMYSLALLLAVLSWLFFVRWTESGSSIDLAGWILVDTAFLYTHYYSLFFLAGQILGLFLFLPFKIAVKRSLLAGTLLSLFFAPYLARFFTLSKGIITATFWCPPVSIRTVWELVSVYSSGYEASRIVYITVGLACASAALFGILDRQKPVLQHYLIAAGIIPVSLALLTSLLLPTCIFVPRYTIFALAPFLIAIAHGINRFGSRKLTIFVLSALTMIHAFTLSYHYRNDYKSGMRSQIQPRKEFREASRWIDTQFLPGDIIGTTCESGTFPVWYYLVYLNQFPPAYFLDIDDEYRKDLIHKFNLDDIVQQYPEVRSTNLAPEWLDSHQRLWVYKTDWCFELDGCVDFYTQHNKKVLEWLETRYEKIEERSFIGVSVILFDLTGKHPADS